MIRCSDQVILYLRSSESLNLSTSDGSVVGVQFLPFPSYPRFGEHIPNIVSPALCVSHTYEAT